jgi:hypothetical protein
MIVTVVELAISDTGIAAILPFQAGVSHPVLQGNNGPWGHSGHAAFAFDFRMDTGTLVIAARAGQVVKAVDSFFDDNGSPSEENFVVIRHDNGTYGRYYHLAHEGSMVTEGQWVSQGQPVALSGNTGASAGPHLHFDITGECYEWGCKTLPVSFDNICGRQVASVPVAGDSVGACPIPRVER